MNLDAALSTGPAQRALLRLLKTAFADRARGDAVVRQALASAGLDALPENSFTLLDFVKAHLVPRMRSEGITPQLVSALIDDLEAEIENERLGDDPFSSSRMAISTRMPDRLPITDPAPPDVDIPKHTPPAFGLQDLGDLLEEPANSPPPQRPAVEVLSQPKVARAARHVARPSVVLVDGDRFGRAGLARALVQGQCDVNVLDLMEDIEARLRSADQLDVLILDVDFADAAAILAEMVRSRVSVPVLAWTKSPRAVAEHVLRTAGIRSFDVMTKGARTADVLDAVRRLADEAVAAI